MAKTSGNLIAATLVAGAALLTVGTVQAATVITVTDHISVNAASADTETQIFLDGVDSAPSGTGHIGSQTGDAGTPPVSFVTNINAKYSNGFAEISALKDTVISSLTVSVPTGWFFTDLAFSTHKADQVTIAASNGSSPVGSASATGVGNSDFDWLIQAIDGYEITKLVLTSTDGFDQLKHFQISGLHFVCQIDCPPNGPPVVTPLPAALPLFAGGLGVLALLARRRKKRAPVTA